MQDKMIMPLKIVNLGITGLLLFGIIIVCMNNFSPLIIIKDPFIIIIIMLSTFPLFISILMSWIIKSNISQTVLLISSLTYTSWFIYIVFDAFYVHPDALSGLVFLGVGILSLPVMVPLWGISAYFNGWTQKIRTTNIDSDCKE
jgi:hypothetical protein